MLLQDTQAVDRQCEELLTEQWGEQKAKEMVKKSKDLESEFTKFDMLDD